MANLDAQWSERFSAMHFDSLRRDVALVVTVGRLSGVTEVPIGHA